VGRAQNRRIYRSNRDILDFFVCFVVAGDGQQWATNWQARYIVHDFIKKLMSGHPGTSLSQRAQTNVLVDSLKQLIREPHRLSKQEKIIMSNSNLTQRPSFITGQSVLLLPANQSINSHGWHERNIRNTTN
jgi:transketolase